MRVFQGHAEREANGWGVGTANSCVLKGCSSSDSEAEEGSYRLNPIRHLGFPKVVDFQKSQLIVTEEAQEYHSDVCLGAICRQQW